MALSGANALVTAVGLQIGYFCKENVLYQNNVWKCLLNIEFETKFPIDFWQRLLLVSSFIHLARANEIHSC